nr:alpha/beta fold hydrolase [Aeromonas schubertii]
MTMNRQMQLLLLVEVVMFGALGHLLFGLGLAGSVLFVLLVQLVLRVMVVLATWGFSRFFASPAPPLGVRGWLWMIGVELYAYILTFNWLIPFETVLMRHDRMAPCRRPLLLVHGYGCNRGIWLPLVRRLERRGHVVATLSLTPPFGHIDDMVPQLARRIDAVLIATGATRVTLIGHSMGGLVCRDYLALHGAGKVDRLVTLATPHQGSELANLGIGDNAREMEPGSGWLQRFAAMPIPVTGVSVRTTHDNFVMPQDRQHMAGLEDVPLVGVGHLSLLYLPVLTTLIEASLADSEPQKERA